MTEKRFVGEEDSDYIRDNKTDERELYLCDWLDKLNELSDENEQLKQQISEQGTQLDFLQDENKHMRDVLNENEQLKKVLSDVAKDHEVTVEDLILWSEGLND